MHFCLFVDDFKMSHVPSPIYHNNNNEWNDSNNNNKNKNQQQQQQRQHQQFSSIVLAQFCPHSLVEVWYFMSNSNNSTVMLGIVFNVQSMQNSHLRKVLTLLKIPDTATE